MTELPPSFCWKKGGDGGVIPKGCPVGYFRSMALCYKNCNPGYKMFVGVCYTKCGKGETDIGAFCKSGAWYKFNWKPKRSYIPKSLTNFSDQIPCPTGRYRAKGGALCYKDCKSVNMANCGIGACAASSD